MYRTIVCITALMLSACGSSEQAGTSVAEQPADEELLQGPNNGRLLVDGPFAVELAMVESGVPPEYHAWPTLNGRPVPLDSVRLTVSLVRLDNTIETFNFTPHGRHLRGDREIHRPHSFVVKISAQYQGQSHEWTYDNFEGRTSIATDIAERAGIKTEAVGPATLIETVALYGRIVPADSHRRVVTARFPGIIRSVAKKQGDSVRAGEALAVIESNESLRTYTITAPIGGIVVQRDANEGEQSGERALFTLIDPSTVRAELAVFSRDRARIRPGAAVTVQVPDSNVTVRGTVDRIDVLATASQTVNARVTLDNSAGQLLVGSFVTAEVTVAEHRAPLAVKSTGLQPFRDFTVVFERIEDTYEVRMLELGRKHGEWVEVLGGVAQGAQYVSEGSYLLKADVEKSGASHEH